MAQEITAKVTFTQNNKVKSLTLPVTISADGSISIALPQGRIVPGTDVKVEIPLKGKIITRTVTPSLTANGTVEVRLPAGSAPALS